MRDYGQPGGAGYPPQSPPGSVPPQPPSYGAPPPPAPLKKKGGKGLLIVGVILLIVGILIAVVGLLPTLNAKSAEDLDEDYDTDEHGFKSYDEGDTVVISGKITNKSESAAMDAYVYEIDDKGGFLSSSDIGNEGDTVTVECEVKVMDLGAGATQEYLEAKAVVNVMPLIIIGIILLIIGIILMMIGIKKKKKV